MRRTRIKFCGITRPVDAVAAADAGADSIGLNFYSGSSRCVTVSRARDILDALPLLVTPVALFVNHKPSEIREIAEQLKIRTVQLHGDEPLEYLGELSDLTVIKVLHFNPDTILELLQKWKDAAGLLMETASKSAGGTGIENNWKGLEAVKNAGHFEGTRLIVAGGLTPDNVGDVVRRMRPWAVDVSTGIEESRGIKSVDKMRRFAKAVREADQLQSESGD